MDSDVHSTSESGYCLKHGTRQTQTEISTSEEAIQTDPPRTREISVQTCDIENTNGRYPVWIKCGVGLIAIIVCVLVLYRMDGYISCSKNDFDGSSGQCEKYQCHRINGENPQDNTNDVTDLRTSNEIVHMKDKYQGDGDTILNFTSRKSEDNSSNAILKKKIQEFEASEYDLKQTQSEELKHRVEHEVNQTLIELKLKYCYTTLKQMELSMNKVNKELKTARKVIPQKDKLIKETRQSLQTAETLILEQKKLLNATEDAAMLNKEKVIELENKTAKLNEEKNKIETSHSELMAASSARNNFKLTKMEDYSHENLAIEFREIYDEEYSNADDELKALQNAQKVKSTEYYLLNIVKMAYQLCSTYATEHKQSINESVTSIGVKTSYKNEKQKNSQETVRLVSIGHLMSTLELDDIANLTLSTAIRLQKPIIEVLSEIIVDRFDIEPEKQPEMMKYIRKCLEVCWMMNMHSDPIFVKFEDVTDLAIFDTKTYKVYDNGGKFLDFIVWPPVYAFEGGKLIRKGIAEGKEN